MSAPAHRPRGGAAGPAAADPSASGAALLWRAVAWFPRLGIRVRVLLTDNP